MYGPMNIFVCVCVDKRVCLIENSGDLNQSNRLVVTALSVWFVSCV